MIGLSSHRPRWHRAVILAVVALVAASAAAQVRAAGQVPDFTLSDRVLVGSLGGYGGQFNQHVYATISGPPPDLPGFETKVLALQPQFARVFFNTTEWTYPDRMASFVRAVDLARRANAQINITWQGSSFAFAAANMPRFADVLAELLRNHAVDALWVTLFNEPNSTRLTLAQYERSYRLLDGYLRDRGVRDRVRFMGGDLVGTTSPLGQSQEDWFRYMAQQMGDLLDAWSIHVFWDFWDPGKIDRRLLREVLVVYATIPDEQRRPLYVTEYGVRGLRTFDGEANPQPGLWPDGTPLAAANDAAFQEGWFVIRAAELGYVAALKWDLYNASYDAGLQDYSAIGPGTAGWPLRPAYRLLQLITLTTKPGWQIVDVDRAPAADPAKLLAAYVSPAKNVTVLGLDTDGATPEAIPDTPEAYRGRCRGSRCRRSCRCHRRSRRRAGRACWAGARRSVVGWS